MSLSANAKKKYEDQLASLTAGAPTGANNSTTNNSTPSNATGSGGQSDTSGSGG